MLRRVKRQVVSIILIASMLLALTACAKEAPSDEKAEQEPSVSGNSVRMFEDDAGRNVEIPEKISRVVTLGTNGQVMMLSLAPELLMGINTDLEVEPEEYMDYDYSLLPVIGQYYGQRNLNLEEIAENGADIIIDLGDTKDNVVEDMEEIQKQSGIPTIHINAMLETSPDAFRKLGELLDCESRAEELAAYCEKTYEKVISVMARVPQEERARILLCSDPDGYTITIKGTSHSEILELTAENVADVTGNNGIVSIEQMHVWDPDVILFKKGSIYSEVQQYNEWKDLTAIQEGRFYEIPEGPYCWLGYPPAVNRYPGLLWLVKILYPDYCDFDLQEEVKEYYHLFYGKELSDEKYRSLTEHAF